jgi:hypothetical protein
MAATLSFLYLSQHLTTFETETRWGFFHGHIAFIVVDLLTEVDYQEMEDVISTIDEIIENNRYHRTN